MANIQHIVMTLSEPGSKDEDLELGPSDRDGPSPLACLENPGAEDDVVPGPSGIGGGS